MGNPIPGQVRAVDPYSSYQSNNVNIMTRMISEGENIIINSSTEDLQVDTPGGTPSQLLVVNPGRCIIDDMYIEIETLTVDVNDIDYYFTDPGGVFPENGYYYLVMNYEYIKVKPAPDAKLLVLTASQRASIYDLAPEKFLFLKSFRVINYDTSPLIDAVYDTDPETSVTRNVSRDTLQDIIDVDAYVGNAYKHLSVNATEDGTEWVTNIATATALQTARLIGGVSFDGSANIVPDLITTINEVTDTNCFVGFFTGAEADQQPRTNNNLIYNSASGALTASGGFVGNASSATVLETARSIGGVSFNGSAAITPQNIQVVDESADTSCYVAYFNSATGNLQPKTGTNLIFNSSTGALTASGGFVGNASSATVLETAREIGGTLFDGSADIFPIELQAALYTGTSVMSIPFISDIGSGTPIRAHTGLTYQASSGTLTATGFSGNLVAAAPTAPTPAAADDSNRVATTAFVKSQGGANADTLDGYHLAEILAYNGTAYYDNHASYDGYAVRIVTDGTWYSYVAASTDPNGTCHSNCHGNCHTFQ